MSLGSFLTKTTGLGAIYLSIIDAHRIGIASKNKAPKAYIAQTYPDEYLNSQRMTIESLPTVVSGMKRSWFGTCLDDTWIPGIKGVTGYISGFTKGLWNNIVPLSLGLGATLSKRFGKFCTIGLGLQAAKIFIFDILNIGKPKHL